MAITKKKKKVPTRRLQTGLKAVPLDRNFEGIKYYFHYEIDRKETATCIKDYIKKNFTKDQAKAANANPDYKFTMFSHYGAAAFLLVNHADYDFGEKYSRYPQALKEYCETLIAEGKVLLTEKQAEAVASDKPNVVPLSPQQRLANKVNETIMVDLDELEDSWISGEKTELKLYDLMKKHDLKGAAVPMIVQRLEGWLSDYADAYNKTCEQAVEGYSHLTRREIKRRKDAVEQMISELDSFKAAQKAQRAPRVKKPKSADKQVEKVQYKKEDTEFKIASINPTNIIGSNKLYVFNTKYRQLTVYSTDAVKGFEVSGTTIKNFYPDDSTKITIRANKVDEVIKAVLTKTPKQLEKYLSTLTTKPAVPNGRLNNETVLLRVM